MNKNIVEILNENYTALKQALITQTIINNTTAVKQINKYKKLLSTAIILLREENTKYNNNQTLSNELGAPLKLIQTLDKELSEL